MRYHMATNEQLHFILGYEKDCPTHLLSGVVEELAKRNELKGYVKYAAKKSIKNIDNVLKEILKMDWQDIIQIGMIEIFHQSEKFKPGMRTPKTFFIMCLMAKFNKLLRDCKAEKRIANTFTKDHEALDEKIQEAIFKSPVNVERYVINKIMLEDLMGDLTSKERTALVMLNEGHTQAYISKCLGYKSPNSANMLINRAYDKMRKRIA